MRDQTGAPLVGATIAIFDAMAETEQPVRNAKTDDEGRFTASVAPGRYLLRAVATGFNVMEARALVAANRETKIDSIALRRVDTLADRHRPVDPYHDAVLSSRGHILHFGENPDERREEADAQAIALTEASSSTHGVLQTVAASGTNADYVATNFALAHHTLGSDLILTGQTGVGRNAPRRLEALTATDIGETHRLSVAFGFGELQQDGPKGSERLGEYSVRASDRWQIAGPLVLVYGLDYARFSGSSDADVLLPRVGVELAASPTTQVFARLTPGAALTEVARFDLETGEATFTEPERAPLAVEHGGVAVQDRSRRLEFGVGHLIDERSNIEMMAFFDTASGHGVGFLAVPASGLGGQEFSTGELGGRTSGVRVLYTRKLNGTLTGTVGYAVGRGMKYSGAGIDDPASIFAPSTFNVVATSLEADFATGTHVSAIYRFSSDTVVFAIDPFAGRLTAYEPAASIFVSQSLPSLGFIPGQWEATLDIRNLFDARTSVDDDLVLADFSRLVRAGVSLRF